MKTTLSFLIFCGLGTLLSAQTKVTLDGASGSQTYSLARTTDGGLSLGLAFQVEYLVVGGGGGGGGANGGYDGGGGGGAGGMLTGATFLNADNINVTVGQGGERGYNSSSITDRRGKNGGNSTLGNLIAVGGGGGGAYAGSGEGTGNGLSGGSGGGASGGTTSFSSGSPAIGGSQTAGQGYWGGRAAASGYGWVYGAGGGGGAGGSGGDGTESSALFNEWARGGNGGAGLASSISGVAVIYAGGGGGGAERGNFGAEYAGSGGSGGGGNGSTGNGNNGGNGTNNLGGGGGGAGNDANGGNGGSGIVIVRYKGNSAGSGGAVTSGTGTAAGYTIHTFTTTGSSSLNLSGLNLDSRLGAVENGVISGSGDLTFTGPGRLTLNAANTYSGLTRIDGGSLAIGSSGSISGSSGVSIANGANFNVSTALGGFTVDAGQTLSGGGSITGNITIAGTHSPGFSPGLQTFDNNLTYASGANIIWELTGNTLSGRGTSFDGIDVTGDLSFSDSTTISLEFALSGSTVNWADPFWSTSKQGTDGWQIYSTSGQISGFGNLSLSGSFLDSTAASLASVRGGASFSLFEAQDGIYLNYTAIPETQTTLLPLLLGFGFFRRRRSN